ncbi:MAG: DUF1501 domain-containing protein, partial [Planctomycetes bacterium]|nr:DUF1501 domain-containing protein [Planctomycetota bacterium]
MLTITGDRYALCDGLPRRGFLKIGALGFGGLMLPDLLRAEAAGGSSRKALINIHLPGAPSHQDLWDLKPDAPAEFRGEFRPMRTRVPGMEICELLPGLARRADRFAILRGLVGAFDDGHNTNMIMTGYPGDSLKSVGGRPSIGSVISKLAPASSDPTLPFVSLLSKNNPTTSGYLGPLHQPFMPEPGTSADFKVGKIDASRLRSRTELLRGLDGLRRDVDAGGQMDAMDAYTQRAVEMVLSGRMADALDLSKEKPETLKRYLGSGKDEFPFSYNRRLVLARRLIEAGVRCVALEALGLWDTHEDNFNTLRRLLPALDMGLCALLDDLHDRGLLGDVTVAAWGEFGRTPRI